MKHFAAVMVLSVFWASAQAEDSASQQKIKALKEWGKQDSGAILKVSPYLADADVEVRREAVRALVSIGTQRSLDPLVQALRDTDSEIQIRATDGIVNFYFPGYVETGLTAQLKRAGAMVSSVFKDQNDQVIDPDIQVRPEILLGLVGILNQGASPAAKANAARALGILRAREAGQSLVAALRTKDDGLMYESLIALQKIGDASQGAGAAFLIRDLNEKIQLAALETAGILRTPEAIPYIQRVLEGGPSKKARRGCYLALARIGDASSRATLSAALEDRDEETRAAALEGMGRIGSRDDLPMLGRLYSEENRYRPRLAVAFSLVRLGRLETDEQSPLRYLLNTLNSRAWRGVALSYLTELGRQLEVRNAIQPLFDAAATRDEKSGVAIALAGCRGADAIPLLERLSRDDDAEVGREALRSLRILKSSL